MAEGSKPYGEMGICKSRTGEEFYLKSRESITLPKMPLSQGLQGGVPLGRVQRQRLCWGLGQSPNAFWPNSYDNRKYNGFRTPKC